MSLGRYIAALVALAAVALCSSAVPRLAAATSAPTYVRTIGLPPLGHADMYASGIDAAPNGAFIAVADTGNERVLTYTPEGAQFAPPFGSHGSSKGRFNMPRDVAVDGEGNIYVADMLNNRIQKFTSAGVYLTSWKGSAGSALGNPMGLDVDDAHVVWVTDTGHDRIVAFDTNGAYLGIQFGGAGKGAGQFSGPRDVTANEYAVYVADTLNNRVQMFSRAGTFIKQWGVKGTGDGKFIWPYGVTTDALGRVYVLDSTNARVQIFDQDGNFLAKLGQKGENAALGQLWGPRRVAVDPAGNIYVASMWNYAVQKFGPYTSPGASIPWLQMWGGTPPPAAGLNQVRDVALGPDGNVYTIDRVNQRVQAFSPGGDYLFGWGQRGGQPESFGWPEGIALDGDGNVYVTDTDHDQVKKFARDGTLLAVFGTKRGREPGQFKAPEDVLLDGTGNIYVADTGNGRIQKLSPTGQVLLIIGTGFNSGALKQPSGLFLTAAGHLFVADRKLSLVKEYSSTGDFIRQIGFGPGSGSGQLSGPRGVTVTPGGEIIVADTGNDRLEFFTPTGAFDLTYGSTGGGNSQFFGPNGLLLVGSTLYVADTYNSRIQVVALP